MDDLVFLKISPMIGVMQFGKKGKLNPRYVGPYHILRRVGNIVYEFGFHQFGYLCFDVEEVCG